MNRHNFSRFSSIDGFIPKLAAYVLRRYASQPAEMATLRILLPSRRSCRMLHEALVAQSEGRPLLLPVMQPIGEMDVEEDFSTFFLNDMPGDMADVRGVISNRKRQAMLATLIKCLQPGAPAQSFRLADALGTLLDEATQHGLDLTQLSTLVTEESLAEHWQQTLRLLEVISRQWPRLMEEGRVCDGATAQRDRTLFLARQWRDTPPDFPIIAAGSTGSVPATAELLATIARLPHGLVILPALDAAMPDAMWHSLDATHPHYALKKLLEKCGVQRHEVAVIGELESDNLTLRTLFAPAPLTGQWQTMALDMPSDLSHVRVVEAATQLDEARMIAVAMRHALDTPDKTAALITPDRDLARKVAAQLARYDIAIDDSAGEPLRNTPAAIIMRLLLEVITSAYAPHTLLALLRHPLTALGRDTAQTREYSRLLEIDALRGVRRQGGMAAIIRSVKEDLPADFCDWLESLAAVLRPLEVMWLNNVNHTLAEYIEAHCRAAEAIATTDTEAGAVRLWGKESGEQLVELLRQWRLDGADFGVFAARDYPSLFEVVIAKETYRPRYGLHPRLHILSPIEARLLAYDLVILGELSEGVWPHKPAADPWLSIPMREKLGLTEAGFAIGQSAHDVWTLLHAKDVLLMRAHKIGGKPALPSRWWVRLSALAEGKAPELLTAMNHTKQYDAIIKAQDAPTLLTPLARPAPTPPASARPRRISVTQVEQFRSDAYRFYAKNILRLNELPPLDQEPDAADFGTVIHKALEQFVREFPEHLPDHAYQRLLECGRWAYGVLLDRPAVRLLWWPRFEAIATLFLEREAVLRQTPCQSQCEIKTECAFEIDGTTVTLVAKADRIDTTPSGVCLIDYKTGALPTASAIKEGKALQLPLTALAQQYNLTIHQLIYWGLKGKNAKDGWVEVECTAELLTQTRAIFADVMRHILANDSAFMAEFMPTNHHGTDGYDYLTRQQEWGGS